MITQFFPNYFVNNSYKRTTFLLKWTRIPKKDYSYNQICWLQFTFTSKLTHYSNFYFFLAYTVNVIYYLLVNNKTNFKVNTMTIVLNMF